ncbi:CRISPR-associated Cas3 family helicase [Kineothrix alysoides]|uniref:CRISPR-associated Cas3 family helicase n=1 Tax=Kineothrix alysoides TaxID=1469948 RepID=A0A4R1QQ67_9FIRM|nr:CRISPR-associated helicase/endonuclease Cas3 [Kineothrix alysoides]TCL55898.1 CRISPR-associated Cas3 family helicase [Kineothrix alysoides]
MIAHINEKSGKEQSVLEHLENTAKIAGRIGSEVNLENLSYITGFMHDLGKWRKTFENYLRDAIAGKAGAYRGSVNHSSAGAIYIYNHYYKGSREEKLTAQLISVAIFSHHGLMDCLTPEGEPTFMKRIASIQDLEYEEVINNLRENLFCEEHLDELFRAAVEEVRQFQRKIEKLAKQITSLITDEKERRKKEVTLITYFHSVLERMLLSILIEADRLDTAIFCMERSEFICQEERKDIWTSLVYNLESYLEQYQKSDKISILRTKISEECLQFSKRPAGIYRLFVPTGGAKTLSSLRYAVHHAKKYNKKRILYLAPYLSILEQNAEVFREALHREEFILEHHSNIITDANEETWEVDRRKFLTENWESPIIVTTFVQFLNTLFSDSTQSVRRFHSLADSVIIVDEIQSMPLKIVSNFNLAINFLHDMLNATVILCSATQPELEGVEYPLYFSSEKDIIKDYTSLYQEFKRVEIIEKEGLFDIEGLKRFIVEIIKKQNSLLVILNTKIIVKNVYQELLHYYEECNDEVKIIHLSNNMCAEHRLRKIEELKETLGKEKIICISTNLIEAGVDLSFSCVIRSFAGLDSIAQAAGRCNRNGEIPDGLGIVYLVNMKDESLDMLEQIRIGAECSKGIVKDYHIDCEAYDNSLLSPKAMKIFYQSYYHGEEQKSLMRYPIRKLNTSMIELLSRNKVGMEAYVDKYGREQPLDMLLFQSFKSAGKSLEIIDQETISVLVPYEEGEGIIARLNGEPDLEEIPSLLKQAQRYTVNLYSHQMKELNKNGALANLLEGNIIALKGGFYDENIGIRVDGNMQFLTVD